MHILYMMNSSYGFMSWRVFLKIVNVLGYTKNIQTKIGLGRVAIED